MAKTLKFEASRVSEVAEKAAVDIRTVLKVAEGKPVKGKGKLERIQKALASLGLGLVLLVVGCDGGGLEVEAPDVGACQTWGVVGTIGPNQGERICLDGTPAAACHVGEVDHCQCADGQPGYRTCGDAGVLNPCACQ